jgi:hypothetical protein
MRIITYMQNGAVKTVNPVNPAEIDAIAAAFPGSIILDSATLPPRADRDRWRIVGGAVVVVPETAPERSARVGAEADRLTDAEASDKAMIRTLAAILMVANPTLTQAQARAWVRQEYRAHLNAIIS